METEFRMDQRLTVLNIHENYRWLNTKFVNIVFVNVYRNGQRMVRSKFCFHAMVTAVVGWSFHLS
jgi:hypothetical protein